MSGQESKEPDKQDKCPRCGYDGIRRKKGQKVCKECAQKIYDREKKLHESGDKCPECKGAKKVFIGITDKNESLYSICPVCKGTGKKPPEVKESLMRCPEADKCLFICEHKPKHPVKIYCGGGTIKQETDMTGPHRWISRVCPPCIPVPEKPEVKVCATCDRHQRVDDYLGNKNTALCFKHKYMICCGDDKRDEKESLCNGEDWKPKSEPTKELTKEPCPKCGEYHKVSECIRGDIDNPLFLILANLVSTSRVGMISCEPCLKGYTKARLRPTIQTCRECPAMMNAMELINQLKKQGGDA